MIRSKPLLATAALTLSVAAGAASAATASSKLRQAATPTPRASATTTALAVTCPPTVAPSRRAGAPVDDILGVRPGMAYDDAVALVACSEPRPKVKPDSSPIFKAMTYGQPVRLGFEARGLWPPTNGSAAAAQASELIMPASEGGADLLPGQVRWHVATFGPPGQEKVLHVARGERFGTEAAPAIDTLAAALKAKYGAPTDVRMPDTVAFGQPLTATYLWAFGQDGKAYKTLQGLPSTCSSIPTSPDASISYSASCGTVITVRVRSTALNAGLADTFELSIVNMEAAAKLLDDTQTALARLDSVRASQEVDAARKHVPPPKL